MAIEKNNAMLVLSRKPDEEIVIRGNIRVTVVSIKGNTVRLGIEAPDSDHIVRGELKKFELPPQAPSPPPGQPKDDPTTADAV